MKLLRPVRVAMELRGEGDKVIVRAAAAPPGLKQRTGTIWLALVKKSHELVLTKLTKKKQREILGSD